MADAAGVVDQRGVEVQKAPVKDVAAAMIMTSGLLATQKVHPKLNSPSFAERRGECSEQTDTIPGDSCESHGSSGTGMGQKEGPGDAGEETGVELVIEKTERNEESNTAMRPKSPSATREPYHISEGQVSGAGEFNAPSPSVSASAPANVGFRKSGSSPMCSPLQDFHDQLDAAIETGVSDDADSNDDDDDVAALPARKKPPERRLSVMKKDSESCLDDNGAKRTRTGRRLSFADDFGESVVETAYSTSLHYSAGSMAVRERQGCCAIS
mmetsp:Transcript_19323/g.58459  ORF Transcript_19323/g.58459 Transcript_19323/m.58459 type:complete len:269 (-) Transcript_19323:434-1240(-)